MRKGAKQDTSLLYDQDAAVDFYEERYAQGYMDEWPVERKQRIVEVIRSLDLPEAGEAIDFGCGNGVLTNVMRQALPRGWKVYGTDISTIAVENARERYPECVFFATGDSEFTGRKFDFLFTHHVLEHVFDLSHTLEEMDRFLKDKAAVLHILPCGNEGSFEHGICLLRKDGINPQLENRFFFEDEGHVRRLSTEQLSKPYREKEFSLAREYYSNQYYGAVNWITQAEPGFVRSLTDPSSAADAEAKSKLRRLRYKLCLARTLRYPAVVVDSRLRKRSWTARDYLFLALGLPLYLFTKPMDSYLKGKALEEWQTRKTERNGSEMYLCFKR